MWHNGTDPASRLYPFTIRVVSTALPPGLAVRLDFDSGHLLLLDSGDARLVAGGLLDAAADIERVSRA